MKKLDRACFQIAHTRLGLQQVASGEKPSIHHISVRAAGFDAKSAAAKLKAANIEVTGSSSKAVMFKDLNGIEKVMFDLQVLAFRAEITRVATMMYARDTSGAVNPQSGVREGFHVASHHSNSRANMDRFVLINKYHVEMLAYFLDELKSTPLAVDARQAWHRSGCPRRQHREARNLEVLVRGTVASR